MKYFLFAFLLSFSYQASAQAAAPLTAQLDKVSLTFALGADGRPSYAVTYGGRPVITPSRLGLSFTNGQGFDGPLQLLGS